MQQRTEEGLSKAALRYYSHYNDSSNSDIYRSGSRSLVDAEELSRLAETVKDVNKNSPDWRLALEVSLIQKVDRTSQGILYDFRDTFDVAKATELVGTDEYEQTMQAYEAKVLVF